LQFLRYDTYSLLIKGDAGTGKTTLSLTILKALNVKSNFFYISTRVSPKQLFTYYPWLNKLIEEPRVSQPAEDVSDKAYNLSSFEDARLDEPESLFERITNQLMDVKAPVIIIDSWDAIASFMDKEARLNNERVLQTWCERAGAKLILISEDPTNKTLDFLVDGIVELQQKFYDDLKIRQVILSKLRGIKIQKPSYIYSLNKGIFRSYSSYSLSDFVISSNSAFRYKKAKHTLVPLLSNKSYIASGYSILDTMWGGGFPHKGIVLIDMDSSVNLKIIMAFLSIIVSNFVNTCNPVIIQPFSVFDVSTIESYLKRLIPTDTIKQDLIKIFYPIDKVEKQGETSDYIMSHCNLTKFQQRFEMFRNLIVKTKQDYPDKLLLNILGIEMPILWKSIKLDEFKMRDTISLIRSYADLTVLLTNRSQTIEDYLTRICDIHLKLKIINGTLFLHSLSPHTRLYAITTTASVKYPKIKLEPIV
jgi:KaiC/GvpD/RAD55 family RecA-like ATPase